MTKGRKLLVLGGIVAVAAIALRRYTRRDVTDVEIDDAETRERPTVEDASAADLESLDGIGPAYAERLQEAGVGDVADLPGVDATDLARETGIEEGRIRDWAEQARDRIEN